MIKELLKTLDTRCVDCCLEYIFPDHSRATCLATHFKIRDVWKTCINGYKYETDV